MAGQAFAAAIQRAVADSSRRGLFRGGIGALTGLGLAVLDGRSAADTAARRRRRKKKRRSRRPNQSSCTRDEQCRSGICGVNRLGQVCCVSAGAGCTADNDCCGETSLCDLENTGVCYTP